LENLHSTQPGTLYAQFINELSDDFLYLLRQRGFNVDEPFVTSEASNNALKSIEELFRINGRSLADFADMPLPVASTIPSLNINSSRDTRQEFNYCQFEQKMKSNEMQATLNSHQRQAFDSIMAAVSADNRQTSSLFFIDGPGGSGKTYLYNTILAAVRGNNKVALPVASSGIAAELLDGGRTAHSRFKIPIPTLPHSTCSISRQSSLTTLIRSAAIVIWDEAPTMHKHVFECVDHTFRDLFQNDQPFGGITFVMGGDFRQILPVVRHGSKADIVMVTLKKSYLWQDVVTFHLNCNMRIQNVATDYDFEKYLLDIGDGSENIRTESGRCKVNLPKEWCISPGENAETRRIETIFPDPLQTDYNRAILCTKNDVVDRLNKAIVHRMTPNKPERVYLSADEIIETDYSDLCPNEFLNSITPAGLPPHKLTLKEGAPVMLLRNINAVEGLLNGTRLSIEALGDRVITAKILTGRNKGTLTFIPRITLMPSDGTLPFVLRRRQFPIRPHTQ